MSDGSKPTVWVLTEEYNAYDQYGRYFLKAWLRKPNLSDLMARQGITMEAAAHIRNGGGRQGNEDQWYRLTEEDAS